MNNNNPPKYVYQSEVFDIAWTHDRKGFLVLPDGTKYRYKNPKQWHYPINPEVEDARAKLHEKQSRLQFPYNDAESKMVREMYESFEETHGKNTKKQMSVEDLLANIETAKSGWFNKSKLAPFDISEQTITELN